jgi:hypothetical protein
MRLSGLYAEKQSELGEFRDQIDAEPRLLKTLGATLLRLETECERLAGELADAQREAASPVAEVWGEFRGVAELLAKSDSEDLRLRCRTALRRLVESITCLFTGSKMDRFAAVRVQFHGSGMHRDYVITYQLPNGTRKNPPPPRVVSPPSSWADEVGEIDLRKPADAKLVEKLLSDGRAVEEFMSGAR